RCNCVVDVVRPGAGGAAEGRLVGGPKLLQPPAPTRGHALPADEVLDPLGDHQADQPPSTTRFEPVTYDEASEARNPRAPIASCSSSIRPIGDRAAKASRNSGSWSFETPARVSVFTRTPSFAQYVAR